MRILIENLGKKFGKDWIFRHLHTTLSSNETYAVTGANGSGKSTLLQVIAGVIPASEGKVSYHYQQKIIEPDYLFRHLSLAAPYQELIEEFTLVELVDFHRKFKPLRQNLSTSTFLEQVYLNTSQSKQVKYLSSGMKQRLKLGLALLSDTSVLLLDEPTTNLDSQGIRWYQQLVLDHLPGRLCIICSNQPYEYEFCRNVLHIRENHVEIS